MTSMTPMTATRYRRGELHEFQAAGQDFIYLVAAGAIFALDDGASAVLRRLGEREMTHAELVDALVEHGHLRADAEELIGELRYVRGIVSDTVTPAVAPGPTSPPADFPLQALVLNITNQCNLACTYCYEFGADKIATPEGKPKYMTLETASASVDFLLAQSPGRNAVHITFFGGETLMNFKLLRQVVEYAREQAAMQGRGIGFSLTTNATLLTDEIIEFLAENEIGVTVSMDGPPDLQDLRRVDKRGRGTYRIIEP
uniref:radical SAM protein n=1 Tax=Phenylobacterium sp. TaxID=1871053 RepID=UPI0025FAC161